MKLLLALLAAALAILGIVSERLFSEILWSQQGLSRLLVYAAVYWIAAGLILWRKPSWLIPAAGLFFLAWTIWWTGPLVPLTVLYFLGSAYLLGSGQGRSAAASLVLGTAIWMLVFWVALHFPINRPWFYGIVLAFPYIRWKKLRWSLPEPGWYTAPLVFILLAYGLMVLKPEISADGLSMHLALPAIVADQGKWPFDFQHHIWAVMPAAVDSLYAALYSLGGEPAARMLNFSYLVAITAMIVQAARRWVAPVHAWLAAALFASTPLAGLVTGSLFIENVWAALILAALIELLDNRLLAMSLLLAAALASKLIAAVFLVPITVAAVLLHRRILPLALIALGFLPYADAWIKTGNPIFPFSNNVFKSPYYPSDTAFADNRFEAPLNLSTPYNVTFRSAKYIEGQGGAAGFQWLILLLPALLVTRTKEQWLVVAAGAIPALLILAILPNLRYLYPAMPILAITLAWLEWRASAALILLNLWFLPAADPHDREFLLVKKSEIRPYLETYSPGRLLIDRLNKVAANQPVAFFSTGTIAGLRGSAYSDNWHSEHTWKRLRDARNMGDIVNIFKELQIQWIVARKDKDAPTLPLRQFLTRWTDPEGTSAGDLEILKLRSEPNSMEMPHLTMTTGEYDDSDPRIEYSGSWWNDRQFSQTSNQSVTYSNAAGDKAIFMFSGGNIKYVYTKAPNRGTAEIYLDGSLQGRVAMRSDKVEWGSSTTFAVPVGTHKLEIRVAGDGFVDVDELIVTP